MAEDAGTTLLPGREVPLGGVRGMSVQRWLPHRRLPTVGAWCFLDRIGPQRVDMRVLPHPHTGLQTVTWPLAGQVHHRDSLGSDVLLRPGELNLMTSGDGISHSELSVGEQPLVHAVQLWVALPAGYPGGARFEQHQQLPVHEAPGLRATVLLGALGEAVSPAQGHTPLLGADVELDAGAATEIGLTREHEHAVLVLAGRAEVEGTALDGTVLDGTALDGAVRAGAGPGGGALLYLGAGRTSLRLASREGARLLLLGGEPYADDLVMWWNFVGRTHEEVVQAREDWEVEGHGRFGTVPGHGSDRIPAPPMPGVRLTPRRRPGRQVEDEHDAPAPAMS